MADAVGVVLSSLELSSEVIQYLHALKHAGKDRKAIKREVEAARKIIEILNRLQNDHPDAVWLQHLGMLTSLGLDGAKSLLSEYEDVLHEILQKLRPKDHNNSLAQGVSAFCFKVKWPFMKNDIQAMVEALNRLQNSFHSVLQLIVIETTANEMDKFGKECAWLSDLRPSSQLRTLMDASTKSPPKWIFEDQDFQEWRTDNSSQVLWANGNPGAGKSVLASVVVAHLRAVASSTSTKTSVAVFFYRYNDNVTLETMLRCIARQLLEQGGAELLPKVEEARKAAPYGLGLSEVETLLSNLWSHFHESFLVIDALDECDSKMLSTTVLHLKKLLEGTPSLRIMITSRGNMEMFFLESEYLCQAKRVHVIARDANVREYVGKRIEEIAERPETALYKTDADSRKIIIEKVIEHTVGVFLLAVRHMNALEDCEDRHSLDVTVATLSSDLGKTMEDAIGRIQAQKNRSRRELGMRALLWVLNMMRPMRLAELRDALATYGFEDDLDEKHRTEENNILAATGGLITLERGSGVLSIHKSISDYLNSKHKQLEVFGNNADAEMAHICIKYLCFSRFDTLNWTFDENPFLSYAAPYWFWHLVDSNQKEKLIQDVKGLFPRKRQLQCAIQTLYSLVLFYLSGSDINGDTQNILEAARGTLVQLLEPGQSYDHSVFELLCDGESFTCKLTCAFLNYSRPRDPMIVEKFKSLIHNPVLVEKFKNSIIVELSPFVNESLPGNLFRIPRMYRRQPSNTVSNR